MPDEDKTFSFGSENLMTVRAHTIQNRRNPRVAATNLIKIAVKSQLVYRRDFEFASSARQNCRDVRQKSLVY